MYSSKLIALLSSCSSKEIKSFSAFVSSPFHNTNTEIIQFFNCIKQYHPSFSRDKMSKLLVFNELYPGIKYEDKKVRYLMSDLLKLAERFLLIRQIESSEIDRSLLLLQAFTDRKLDKHYQQLRTKLSVDLAKTRITDTGFFFDRIKTIEIEEEHYYYKDYRLLDDKTQENSVELNKYFALKKLKYSCSLLNRQALLKENYILDLPENWIGWLEKHNYWEEQVIRIYAKVFQVLKYPVESDCFDELLQLLFETEISSISQKDLKELFLYAINYCAKSIREGKNNYVEKALSLYLEGIKNEALLENGYFSAQSFNNVVKLALRLEKYGWIEDFIEEYKHFLPPESQNNTLRYNLAELSCYKKDFDKALLFLSKVEFVNLSYQLGSRIMLSKIYYELKEEKALLSLLGAFMMFLKRNKQISEPIRKTYLNFCDLLFLIIKGKIEHIENEIRNIPLLTDRTWLLEKVVEIKMR